MEKFRDSPRRVLGRSTVCHKQTRLAALSKFQEQSLRVEWTTELGLSRSLTAAALDALTRHLRACLMPSAVMKVISPYIIV